MQRLFTPWLLAVALSACTGGGPSSSGTSTSSGTGAPASAAPPAASAPAPAGEPATRGCVPSGCAGTECVEEGLEVASICEWKPEYECYQAQRCVRGADGRCGFSDPGALGACLAAKRPLEPIK